MVNNINGLTPTQGNTSRSREKPQTPEPIAPKQEAQVDGEQVELSPQAQNLRDVEKNLSQLPEVDQARVSHIKDALRDGSYSVDPARLAAKIAQFELNI